MSSCKQMPGTAPRAAALWSFSLTTDQLCSLRADYNPGLQTLEILQSGLIMSGTFNESSAGHMSLNRLVGNRLLWKRDMAGSLGQPRL